MADAFDHLQHFEDRLLRSPVGLSDEAPEDPCVDQYADDLGMEMSEFFGLVGVLAGFFSNAVDRIHRVSVAIVYPVGLFPAYLLRR